MRSVLFALLFIPVAVCSQQIWSLEQYGEAVSNKADYPEDVTYYKDINNSLDQFLGTWLGIQNGNTITFEITEATQEWYDGVLIDRALIRYKIVNPQGVELVNTLNYPNDAGAIIEGEYIIGSAYTLYYCYGHDLINPNMPMNCGTSGDIVIKVGRTLSGAIFMSVYLDSDTEVYVMEECPNGIANIPVAIRTPFQLMKQ